MGNRKGFDLFLYLRAVLHYPLLYVVLEAGKLARQFLKVYAPFLL